MPATPAYRPSDLNPDAAEAAHTHAHTHPQAVEIVVGVLLGTVVANPANVARIRRRLGNLTITEAHVEVRSAPTGRAMLVELRRNGTLVQTITLPAGDSTVSVTGLSIPWQTGQWVEAVPTQVGSTIPGADLVVTLVATSAAGVETWPA